MEDLKSLNISQLKKRMKEIGVALPNTGSGKNGAVLKKDLIDVLFEKQKGLVSSHSITTHKKMSPPKINISDMYEFQGLLGKGKYGRVYLARSKKTGAQVAIKIMDISNLDIAEREYGVTKNIGCLEHILCYRDLIATDEDVYLVMDYLQGKDLFDVYIDRSGGDDGDDPIIPFSISELIVMFEQLLTGLESLHRNQAAHMDLKIENVRATLGGLVIIDLGMACFMTSFPVCDLKYSPGTQETLSPEMGYAMSKPYPKMTADEFFASDVWMMGLIFKALANLDSVNMKYVPVAGVTKEVYMKRWAEINRLRPTHTACQPLNELVDDMLNINYTKRPSAKELLARIRSIKC